MSKSFTKLFSSITESTVWCEPSDVRIVWICMLAMADAQGRVWASIPGLANRARVSVDAARDAISRFQQPDPDSRTKDFEGRRIEQIDGGWVLLNYGKYRAVQHEQDKREADAERQRRHRALSHAEQSRNVTLVTNGHSGSQRVAQAEAEAEEEGEEEKTKDLSSGKPDDPPNPASKRVDPIPYQAIVDLFNDTLTKLPKVRDLTPRRRTAIRSAWQGSEARRKPEFWRAYFEECAADSFLNGTGPYKNGHENWKPSFDFLIKSDVITRTYEKAMHRLEQRAH